MQDIEPLCSLLFFDDSLSSEIEEDRVDVQFLMTEFLELLDQIRYSIGISILHSKVKNSFLREESEYFVLHYNNAVILSNIASDRLRDLLIRGVLKRPRQEYKRYVPPFQAAVKYLNDFFHSHGFRGVTDSFAEEFLQEVEGMPIMAESITRLRKQRNRIVHEVFTKKASREQIYYSDGLREDKTKAQNIKDGNELIRQMEEHGTRLVKDINNKLVDLRDSYKELIQLGNLIFQAEYMTRNTGPRHYDCRRARPTPVQNAG
jgi:hypothetical protein